MAYNYAREQGLCEISWSWVVMEPKCVFGMRLLLGYCYSSEETSHLHVYTRADNRTAQGTPGMYGYDNMRDI